MNTQFFEQMNDLNRNLYKPMAQLSQLAMQTAETYTRQSISAGNELFALYANYAQKLTTNAQDLKNPSDIMNLQASFWNELSNKCLKNVNSWVGAQQDAFSAYANLFSQNVKTYSDEVQSKAKSVKIGE